MTDDHKQELDRCIRAYIQQGTLDDFVAIIAVAVQRGIEEAGCHGCPAPDSAREHISHFWGVIQDLGEGDYRRGIEQLRDISKFVPQVIAARNSIGNWVLKILVTSITVGVVTAVWGLIKKQ
jgi:hypothetical protein